MRFASVSTCDATFREQLVTHAAKGRYGAQFEPVDLDLLDALDHLLLRGLRQLGRRRDARLALEEPDPRRTPARARVAREREPSVALDNAFRPVGAETVVERGVRGRRRVEGGQVAEFV